MRRIEEGGGRTQLSRNISLMLRVVLSSATLAALVPLPVRGQFGYLRPFDTERTLPQGFQLNSASIDAGAYSLGLPASAGISSGQSQIGTTFNGGWSADMGWYAPGHRMQMLAEYKVSYEGDSKYSQLGGFNHSLFLQLKARPSRRTEFRMTASATQSLLTGYLFQSQGVDLVQTPTDLSQVLAGGVTVVSLAQSPLSVALFGTRRRDATVGATLSHTISPRLTWQTSAFLSRDLPQSATGSASAEPTIYPAITLGIISGGVSYRVHRRTEIALTLDYERDYSALNHSWEGVAAIQMNQQIGHTWVANAEVGYGMFNTLRNGMQELSDPQYNWKVGIGTKTKWNTFLLSARREIKNQFGFGPAISTTALAGWTLARPGSNWSLENSGGYQILDDRANPVLNHLDGWVFQATVRRKLSENFGLAATLVLASDSGQFSGFSNGLTRRATRLSLDWGHTQRRAQ